jgi:Carboxypeptidase regulatory-like domain
MITASRSCLVVLALAQQPARPASTGDVVDAQGKPITGAQVVLYAPPVGYGDGEPVEVSTKTDARGAFSFMPPRFRRFVVNGINLLVYAPGYALTARWIVRADKHFALEKPKPRTVKIEAPDGSPIAGARVAPRLFYAVNSVIADVPPSFAEPLSVTSGADGVATLNYLAARDKLAAVRVSAPTIGTQDILLMARPQAEAEPSVITIKLKKTNRISGRLVDGKGGAVANQPVEIWSRGDATWIGPNTVEPPGGPLRTAADGSFQTADCLMIGLPYRVTVRGDGIDWVLSDWVTIGEAARTLAPFVIRPLRSVSGRVVDRQGKPVAGVEIYQTGDGPKATSTHTDASGQFSLGGFRQGPVFLLARAPGFRFHGRLIKPAETAIALELTRTEEQPTQPMTMLPDPIPAEESRALAKRLVEPLWETAGGAGEDAAKYRVLSSLASVDPARVITGLGTVKFAVPEWRYRLQRELVLALGPVDFEEASAVAESIDDAGTRSWALVHLADRLPAGERTRKLALLDRALLQAKLATVPSTRLFQLGEVAERWYELGEVAKARALFAETTPTARQFSEKTEVRRGLYAARLARVDLPAALEIIKDFDGERQRGGVLGELALRLVDQNPAEAERVWNLTKRDGRTIPMDPTLAWKMAQVDPVRARRIIDGLPFTQSNPFVYLFVALGAGARDQKAAREAFRAGVAGMERIARESPERLSARSVLPIVERTDPALVPEIFWLEVGTRLPAGNPRALTAGSADSRLVTHLAFYDRAIAAVIFEPTKARLEQASADNPAELASDFVAWSLFDPRAAVARLEQLPFTSDPRSTTMQARVAVAQSLARPYEERWREIWKDWNIVLGGTNRDF